MNENPAHLRARAEAEQAAADASSLTNVRERCERSAKAWSKMADQAERALKIRHEREAATLAKVALRDADENVSGRELDTASCIEIKSPVPEKTC